MNKKDALKAVKMPAGRELDALVATYVLGWKSSPIDRGEDWMWTPAGEIETSTPPFSSQHSAMGKLQKAMQAKGWGVHKSTGNVPKDDGQWHWTAWFARRIEQSEWGPQQLLTGWPIWDAHAETEPLAVCRAAIAAHWAYEDFLAELERTKKRFGRQVQA